jgi:N-acetylmuramoyl-L-alanine amidase
MRLKSHKLDVARQMTARLIGGTIKPEIVILHDTAGRLDKGNSADYLATTTKASVHFVIERDGEIVQLVPTNRRAGHAGTSSFHGRPDCNAFSVGIEIVNPGIMQHAPGMMARAWWGETFDMDECGIVAAETPMHGRGCWMPYTKDQIAALTDLLVALFDGIDTLRDITTHWYVSPGRKIDTNPLFPLEHIRARVLGRDDPALLESTARSTMADFRVKVSAPGSSLNMRRWPSFNPNVIAEIPDGAELTVLRRGVFDGREWLCVMFAGAEGWIVARYTQPIKP